MAYIYKGDEGSSFYYNDEAWQPATSTVGAHTYATHVRASVKLNTYKKSTSKNHYAN